MKESKEPPLFFSGTRVQNESNSNARIDQREHIMKLEPMNKEDTFDLFRSLCHKLVCIAATRPNIFATSNIYIRVTQNKFTAENVKQINKVIKYIQGTSEQHLRYDNMSLKTCKVVVFADGSHTSNMNETSQIGYLVCLIDGTEWHLLHCKSRKLWRVVRSPLAAEVHALAERVDAAIMIQHDLCELIGQKVIIRVLTDTKSLYDVLSKGSTMTGKRLMIDVKASKEAYDNYVINELGWIRRQYNLSDALTKLKTN